MLMVRKGGLGSVRDRDSKECACVSLVFVRHFLDTPDAPPATGWMKCYDYNQQCDYYFHQQTGETTYEKPADFVEAQGSQSYVLCIAMYVCVAPSLGLSRDLSLYWLADCAVLPCPLPPLCSGPGWGFGGWDEGGQVISDTTDTVAVGAEATAKAAEQEDDGIEHYIECWDDTYHTPCMDACYCCVAGFAHFPAGQHQTTQTMCT